MSSSERTGCGDVRANALLKFATVPPATPCRNLQQYQPGPCRPGRQYQQRTTWRRRLPSRALFSVGSPPAQRSASFAGATALRVRGQAPSRRKLALRGNAVFSRVPRALFVFLACSFSDIPKFSSYSHGPSSWPIPPAGPTTRKSSNKPCNAATLL